MRPFSRRRPIPNNNLQTTNQAQIEYDKLTSFFKYLVTISTAAIALVFALTFKSTSDFRDDFKERERKMDEDLEKEKISMKEELARLHVDYKDTEKELREKVKAAENDIVIQLNHVKKDAIYTAQIAANNAIENVFKANNIDSFIINVAKQHIKPLIEEDRIKKVDDAIDNLRTDDPYQQASAFLVINNNLSYKLTKNQISKLISNYKTKNNDPSAGYYNVAPLLYEQDKEVYDFIEYVIQNKPQGLVINAVFQYISKSKHKYSMNSVINMAQKNEHKDSFYINFIQSISINPIYDVKDFLNNEELVNTIINDLQDNEIISLYNQLQSNTGSYLNPEEFVKSYFARKTIHVMPKN